MLSKITFKRDPYLLGFSGLLVIVGAALVMHGDVTWKQMAAFLAATFLLPGLFGATTPTADVTDEPLPKIPNDTDPPPPGVGLLVVVVALVAHHLACTHPMTTEQKKAAAEGSYGAALQHCVAVSSTRPEADACASKVRTDWHVDGGAQ